MKTNENGRSMVEMLGVLAIIGVLSAGGLAGYSKAMFKHKLNNTMEQITMLVTNIRTMYGSQGNYTDLYEDLVDLGIVPPVMGSTPSTLTNPFKGGVTIAPTTLTGSTLNNSGFTVTYEGLPDEACIALATADFGSGAGSGFIGAQINDEDPSGEYGTNTEGKAYGMGGDGSSGALDFCGDEGHEDNNTIIWTFY